MLKFRFEKRAKKSIIWRYGHGRYADAWLILHICTGITTGLFGLLIGLEPILLLTLSLLAFAIYELWEAYVSIVEDLENSIIDIFAGGLGVLTVLLANYRNEFEATTLFWLLAAMLIIDFTLLYLGWRTYLKRRVSGLTLHEYPNPKTEEGRRNIKRDQIVFTGFCLLMITAPSIYNFLGIKLLGLFSVVVLLVTYGLKAKY